MKLYFRLLITVIKFLLGNREKFNFDEVIKRSFIVLPTDLDVFRHMTNTRYPCFADLLRIEFLLKSEDWNKCLSKDQFMTVSSLYTRFRRELKLFDKFEVQYKFEGIDDRHIYMDIKFVKDSSVHCHIIEVLTVVERGKGYVDPLSIAKKLNIDENFLTKPEKIKKLMMAEEESRTECRAFGNKDSQ